MNTQQPTFAIFDRDTKEILAIKDTLSSAKMALQTFKGSVREVSDLIIYEIDLGKAIARSPMVTTLSGESGNWEWNSKPKLIF